MCSTCVHACTCIYHSVHACTHTRVCVHMCIFVCMTHNCVIVRGSITIIVMHGVMVCSPRLLCPGYQLFSSVSPNQHQPLIKDSKAPPPYNPNEAYQPGPPKY